LRILSDVFVESRVLVTVQNLLPGLFQLHYCVHAVGERVILPAVVAFILRGNIAVCNVLRVPTGGTKTVIPVLVLKAILYLCIYVYICIVKCMYCISLLICPLVNSTKDFVTLFGSVTGTSFFDKKGLLAPMNPCLDKVVFFRPNTEGQNNDSASLEILDLSSEQLLDGSWNVGFDDPNWSRFDSSLRVIGQMLLLNGCDTLFSTFLDHLSAVALTVPRTIATACRRCSCVFPRLVGFKKNARDQFLEIPGVLGFYQRRPGDAPLQGVTKHQTPLEMAYCTLHADGHSLYNHLSCQGTANLVLEACTHVWNGESLVPLTERLIKAATDFYQRHSVTGYCLALSYRPVGSTLDDSLRGYYFEVPLHHVRTRREMLPRTHKYPCRWFTGHVLCGMIVTQYEVVPQAVQFIDHLEKLCVRFVYFSRENELRSRVFAEKLGLEAGWNCHVSLAEIADSTDRRTLKDFFRSKCENTLENLQFQSALLSVKSVAALPNKARLPTGISAVRPHLEQVDNVPLLVGLITDCTPEANLQMLEIMQVIKKLFKLKTFVFLYYLSCEIYPDHSLVNLSVFLYTSQETSFQLLLLPKLIVACRHRLVSVKGSLAFHFLASCMLSLSLLTSVVAFLPLLFDFEQVHISLSNFLKMYTKLFMLVFFSYASGVQLHSVLPLFSVISLVVWTIVILVMNELIKRRSIRSFIREQRRTKLGFDTKLGMNSPY
uniref:PlsC domain-containing protein n=1 Tax=Angiostrongylus costaricensis TaxID=334426 RepID=A0A158PHK5_ANGCS